MDQTRIDLITHWHTARKALETAKENENAARHALVDYCLPVDKRKPGSNTVKVDYDYKLRVIFPTNYKIKRDELIALLEAASANETAAMSACFTWKPDINEAAWRDLDKDLRAQLASVVESSDGMPQVSLLPPKQKD